MSVISPSISSIIPSEGKCTDDIIPSSSGKLTDARDTLAEGASPSMRELVTNYWCGEHKDATLENMLLDSNASVIDALERPEVLSKLPPLQGLRVLELGAGIGRFTRIIAEAGCREIVAVDFQASACAENSRLNVDNANVKVVCQDATTLDFEQESFDFIFSNWLLMYLSDSEVAAFFSNCLKWLKPGGKLFFRESCMHRSGDATRSFNPTRYRHPNEYFESALNSRMDDSNFGLCVLEHGRIATYVKVKNNPNQFYWMMRKVNRTDLPSPTDLSPIQVSKDMRQLLVVTQPVKGLADFLVEAVTQAAYVHVVFFPNVLSVDDIQQLSAHPRLFSIECVQDLSEIRSCRRGAYDGVHFHGISTDTIELRVLSFNIFACLTNAANMTGLPAGIVELFKALTDA